MARFCSKCGNPLNSEDKVCGNCGNEITQIPNLNHSTDNVSKNNNTKAKKAGIVFAICVVIVVALIILGTVVPNYVGYKGALNKMCNALCDYDMDALYNLSSDINEEIYGALLGDGLYDHYDDYASKTLDKYEETVGAVTKIKYEITDELEWSKRRIDQQFEQWGEIYSIDDTTINKMMSVDLKIIVEGKKKTATYEVQDLILIKENGKWKLLTNDLWW